jgi:hypothetical protein
MRRFAFLGAAAALLFSGAVVLAAASPAPSPSPSAKATATPHPSAAPSASPPQSAGSTPATSGSTFNATIQPLQITGSATVTETSAKTGIVTLRVSGLLDAVRWSVDIDGGTMARPNERVEIASKSGADLTRLATDTVRIHLSGAEMAAFLKAEKSGGVVAVVSDGTRVGYAQFGA